MIREIGVELEAALLAKGCPYKVIPGPLAEKPTSWGAEQVVLERSGTDGFSPVKGDHHGKAPHVTTRKIACKLTIYAQATDVGAQSWEHERKAEHALDLVLVALYAIAKKRSNALELLSGQFVPVDDLAKSDAAGGAKYELLFRWDRGVREMRWDYSEKPTGTVAKVANVTRVTRAHGPEDEAPVTGCGGE